MLKRKFVISIAPILALIGLYVLLQPTHNVNHSNQALVTTVKAPAKEDGSPKVSKEILNILPENATNSVAIAPQTAVKERPTPGVNIQMATLHKDFLDALERTEIEKDGRAEIVLYEISKVCNDFPSNKVELDKFISKNEIRGLKVGLTNKDMQDAREFHESSFRQCERIRSLEGSQASENYLDASIEKGSVLAKTIFAVDFAPKEIYKQDKSQHKAIKDKATEYIEAAYQACDIFSIHVLANAKFYGEGEYWSAPKQIPRENLELSSLFLLKKVYETTKGISKEKLREIESRIEAALNAQSLSLYSVDQSKNISDIAFNKNC